MSIPGTVVVARLAQGHPGRKIEYLLACVLVALGMTSLTHPDMFKASPYFEPFLNLWPQSIWTAFFLGVGVLRLVALLRNGGWKRSPLVRSICAFLGCFVWIQLSFAAANNPVVSLNVWVWPLFFFADVEVCLTAAAEVGYNKKKRKADANGPSGTL
jgi:hypothetical protein